jgi:two-component system, NarL family, sensor histidine kinase BarA
VQPDLRSLPAYDADEALELAGGNHALAAGLLGMLLADLGEQCAALHCALAAGRVDLVREWAHRLHGATCYCGVPGLRAAAAELERAAVAADHQAQGACLRALDRAVEALRQAAAQR